MHMIHSCSPHTLIIDGEQCLSIWCIMSWIYRYIILSNHWWHFQFWVCIQDVLLLLLSFIQTKFNTTILALFQAEAYTKTRQPRLHQICGPILSQRWRPNPQGCWRWRCRRQTPLSSVSSSTSRCPPPGSPNYPAQWPPHHSLTYFEFGTFWILLHI